MERREMAERVHALLREYAGNTPPTGALDPGLTLRDDLGVESLSLVSLAVRLGDELAVDVSEEAMELASLTTVGDLVALGQRLADARSGDRPQVPPSSGEH